MLHYLSQLHQTFKKLAKAILLLLLEKKQERYHIQLILLKKVTLKIMKRLFKISQMQFIKGKNGLKNIMQKK